MCSLNEDQSDQVEINQYGITMATHYDITMGNDIARDAHCEITMDKYVDRDNNYDVIMSNDLYNCVLSALCLIIILLWVVWNKNKNNFMFDQSWPENTFVVFVYGYFTRPLEIS